MGTRSCLAILSLVAVASISAAADRTSYSFSLSRVADGTLMFEGVDGSPWNRVGYECDGCAFLLSSDGVRGPVETTETPSASAMAFRFVAEDAMMDVTCLARKCKVRPAAATGKAKSVTIKRGRTKQVTPRVGTYFTVLE